MYTYRVFFKNEFQGEYKASCASVALNLWEREYQTDIKSAWIVYGAWPDVERISK